MAREKWTESSKEAAAIARPIALGWMRKWPEHEEDIWQVARIACWKAERTYDPSRGALGPWVRAVVRGEIRQWIDSWTVARYGKAGQHKYRRATPVADLGDSVDPNTAEVESVASVLLCLLPEEWARAVSLIICSDLTYSAAAEMMGRSKGSVCKMVRKALAFLRDNEGKGNAGPET